MRLAGAFNSLSALSSKDLVIGYSIASNKRANEMVIALHETHQHTSILAGLPTVDRRGTARLTGSQNKCNFPVCVVFIRISSPSALTFFYFPNEKIIPAYMHTNVC